MGRLMMSRKIDMSTWSSSFVKTLLSVAYKAKSYQGADPEQKQKEAIEAFVKDYNENKKVIDDEEEIDLSKVEIIKENG